MITKIMSELKDLNSVDLKRCYVLKDSIKNSRDSMNLMDKLNVDFTEIRQACMFSAEFSLEDEIIVNYYLNSEELLTALICQSLDNDSSFTIYDYFLKFTELSEDDDLMRKLEMFSSDLHLKGILKSEFIINNNKDLLLFINNLLKDQMPRNPREVYKNTKESNLTNLEFCKTIHLKSSRVKTGLVLTNSSNLCNGLFSVKRSKFDSLVITQEEIQKCYEELEVFKSKSFAEHPMLIKKSMSNSILFSMYLLELVYLRVKEAILSV